MTSTPIGLQSLLPNHYITNSVLTVPNSSRMADEEPSSSSSALYGSRSFSLISERQTFPPESLAPSAGTINSLYATSRDPYGIHRDTRDPSISEVVETTTKVGKKRILITKEKKNKKTACVLSSSSTSPMARYLIPVLIEKVFSFLEMMDFISKGKRRSNLCHVNKDFWQASNKCRVAYLKKNQDLTQLGLSSLGRSLFFKREGKEIITLNLSRTKQRSNSSPFKVEHNAELISQCVNLKVLSITCGGGQAENLPILIRSVTSLEQLTSLTFYFSTSQKVALFKNALAALQTLPQLSTLTLSAQGIGAEIALSCPFSLNLTDLNLSVTSSFSSIPTLQFPSNLTSLTLSLPHDFKARNIYYFKDVQILSEQLGHLRSLQHLLIENAQWNEDFSDAVTTGIAQLDHLKSIELNALSNKYCTYTFSTDLRSYAKIQNSFFDNLIKKQKLEKLHLIGMISQTAAFTMNALAKLPKLTSLQLTNVPSDLQMAQEIADNQVSTFSHQTLEKLEFSHCYLNGDKLSLMAPLLSKLTNLRILRFQNNKMRIEGLRPLVDALCHHRTIEEINLFGNDLIDESITILAPLFKHNKFRVIDLAHNILTNSCAEQLRDLLKLQNELVDLKLDFNRFDGDGIKTIMSFFALIKRNSAEDLSEHVERNPSTYYYSSHPKLTNVTIISFKNVTPLLLNSMKIDPSEQQNMR